MKERWLSGGRVNKEAVIGTLATVEQSHSRYFSEFVESIG